jgi:excinuclease ABC subunit B
VKFKLHSNYQPRGDQPTAIDQLVRGIQAGDKHQVLLGVTGSGKTFTMAKVIEALDRPALVLAHNKTLAAQLYHEFKSFFPENAVEYFVSYYDYYQPEAYVPSADLYIDKESTINDELDKLRMSATRALFERRDVIIVSSVSCIYGLGSPEAYFGMMVLIEKGMETSREKLLHRFVDVQYERSEDLRRGTFRVRGDIIEIYPPYEDNAYRFEMWGNQIETVRQIDPLTGEIRPGQENLARVSIYPKTHYVMPAEQRERFRASMRSWIGGKRSWSGRGNLSRRSA